MPIYEFICSKCNEKFEVLHRSEKDGAPRCPSCGSAKVTKAFSVVGGISVKSRNACGGSMDASACPSCCSRGCHSKH